MDKFIGNSNLINMTFVEYLKLNRSTNSQENTQYNNTEIEKVTMLVCFKLLKVENTNLPLIRKLL